MSLQRVTINTHLNTHVPSHNTTCRMANDAKSAGPNKPMTRSAAAAKTGSVPSKTAEKEAPENSKQRIVTDYIEPPQRRLGPHKNAVNEPLDSKRLAGPVDFQLQKLVGLLIASTEHHPKFSSDVLSEVTQLTTQFMSHFVSSLHKLTEVQRHHKPGLADLEMCLAAQDVSPTELHTEYLRTKQLDTPTKAYARQISDDLSTLLREFNADNYTLDKDDPSLVFHANEQHEIAALVPRQATRRAYIPEYLPELPPDFTFTSTGHYVDTITDLKEIKLQLAEQSRLNEASLYKLIDDDERRWRQSLEHDLDMLSSEESAVEEIMSPAAKTPADNEMSEVWSDSAVAAEKPRPDKVDEDELETDQVGEKESNGVVENTEVPDAALPSALIGKAFDFVAYARKTCLAKERHAREMDRRRKLRQANVFMKAEKVFSPYALAPPTKSDTAFFENVLENAFKQVIKATRNAETKKRERLSRLREAKEKREAEQEEENGAFEFGFAFNPSANLSEDSDEEIHETSKEFDFGDNDAAKTENSRPAEATNEHDVEMVDVGEQSSVNENTGETPHAGQVSGKAPLKTVADAEMTNADDFGDISDGNSEMENELEEHFGIEDTEAGSFFSQLGESGVSHDSGAGVSNIDKISGDGHSHLENEHIKNATRVSWGDLGSEEESEEDELEDVE
ncbi:hypothetical protein OY671_004833 [Metschnikowia pulcherrima]|nr:hypothetical protein OY671_004833 [Metschnikowia pulcherrima]